ncbi:hypothetical protein Tco_1110213 [Tanacetum coccineum]|uniref:Uncharacterized protein n=1 Tax=Tanacetum coccineum TaxID=301880 RepID=A0ABQ5IJM5_9ASTR
MSVQTRYSVVDDETRQGLNEAIVKVMRDELEKLRKEMRDMMIYKDAILRRFGNSIDGPNVQFSNNGVKDSSFNLLDKLEEFSVNHSHIVGKNIGAHKMFDEIPIRNNLKQVMVKESNEMTEDDNVLMSCEENVKSKEFIANDSSEVIDNGIDKEVLDKISKACDECKGFELKKSADLDNDYNYFVGCGKFVQESEKNIEINPLDHTSFVLVETVKESSGKKNEVTDDEKITNDIKTTDVFQSRCFKLTKSGQEKWTRNGVNNKKGKVDVGDLRKYKVGLISVKDALSLGLHEWGKWVFDSYDRNASDNKVVETDCKSRASITSYARGKKLWLKSNEYEFEGEEMGIQ